MTVCFAGVGKNKRKLVLIEAIKTTPTMKEGVVFFDAGRSRKNAGQKHNDDQKRAADGEDASEK